MPPNRPMIGQPRPRIHSHWSTVTIITQTVSFQRWVYLFLGTIVQTKMLIFWAVWGCFYGSGQVIHTVWLKMHVDACQKIIFVTMCAESNPVIQDSTIVSTDTVAPICSNQDTGNPSIGISVHSLAQLVGS